MPNILSMCFWLAWSFIFHQLCVVIYRLYFHPLARYPGPRLAAVTFWWECYQDIFAGQGGEFTNQLEEMHDAYGSIVRVTPDEVHIRDPEWAPVLYAGPGHVRDKDASLAHSAGTADGTFGTVSHDIHRRRRAPVSSYYSKASVAKNMYDKIWQQAERLSELLREHHRTGTVVNARTTFLGWSNDTLSICSFGKSHSLLDDPEKTIALNEVLKSFAIAFPILRQCGWIIPLALSLPVAPFKYINKPLATLLNTHVGMIRRAEEHRKEYLSAKEGKNGRDWQQSSLFHALMASRLPEAEKRPKRMAHEGFEILLAGSDTAARTMGVAIYHILANPEIKCRLQVELDTAIPNSYDQIELRVLEQLPFLNAVLKEVLRIGKITDHRLTLIAPNETLQYREWIIPAGTRVSMTPTRNSFDERFFPEPNRFRPERWLQSGERLAAMNRVFMPFARGRRACLGMHFAQVELQVGLASLFRRFVSEWTCHHLRTPDCNRFTSQSGDGIMQ
ncbi:hypothetical protein ASPCADRAFT_125952 [Aspergillus carbonarius ITEM 5010]|uniref:Cytochrome P450 n=1 Tax=Aspergillus carbonarius (strain ITEM 5010) TaxID=602072 RepID=A0A1R3S2G8_ASPC5|nr:hypothetical protein ASPCADRAFT_125952 [Aspergillus carbonarius ITEM 5010]